VLEKSLEPMNVGEILSSTDPPEDRTKQPIPAGWLHMRFEGESRVVPGLFADVAAGSPYRTRVERPPGKEASTTPLRHWASWRTSMT